MHLRNVTGAAAVVCLTAAEAASAIALAHKAGYTYEVDEEGVYRLTPGGDPYSEAVDPLENYKPDLSHVTCPAMLSTPQTCVGVFVDEINKTVKGRKMTKKATFMSYKYFTPDGRHAYTEVASRRLTITPNTAAHMINTMFKLGTQRKIEHTWVNTLAAGFAAKSRLMPNIGMGTVDVGVHDKNVNSPKWDWAVVDGHHTLLAILQANIPVDVRITWYECCGEEGRRYLYSSFDTNRGKSVAAVIKAHIGHFREPGVNKCSERTLKTCVASLSAIAPSMTTPAFYSVKKMSKDSYYPIHLLETYAGDVLFAADVAKLVHVQKFAVVAAIMVTGRINEAIAREFWDGVNSGVGFKKQDPRLRLRDKLKSGNYRNKSGKTMAQEQYDECITSWETYLKYRVKLR